MATSLAKASVARIEACPNGEENSATNCGQIDPVGRLVEFLPQLVAEIPWGHHRAHPEQSHRPRRPPLLSPRHRPFGWTRNVLLNQIKAGAYERAVTEKKTHNFPLALPEYLAEQADEMLKSSYNLEFLGIRREVKERELEDRLISRLQAFLLELGYGFCFVGRQYRLALGQKEYFIDLLFYHRFLKALVAFELKVGPFEPEYAGKMDFYLNLLNDKERGAGRPAVHRHHPLRGEGRRGGRIRAAHQEATPSAWPCINSSRQLPGELKGKLPTAKQLTAVVRAELGDRSST